MRDYSKSVIYKIYSKIKGVNEIYIGSSTKFNNRCKGHYKNCIYPNVESYYLKLYNYIRDNGGFENFIIEKIEHYPCNNKLQLRQREQHFIDTLKPSLNDSRAYRTDEQKINYYQDNKSDFNIKSKIYYNEHQVELRQKGNEKVQCDKCDKQFTKRNKSRHLQSTYCVNFKKN